MEQRDCVITNRAASRRKYNAQCQIIFLTNEGSKCWNNSRVQGREGQRSKPRGRIIQTTRVECGIRLIQGYEATFITRPYQVYRNKQLYFLMLGCVLEQGRFLHPRMLAFHLYCGMVHC